MKKSNRLFRELMEIESKKKGVWDERKSNLGYRDHLKAIESAEKKIDDNSPLIRSINFFKQSKYTTQQRQIEQRINANVDIVIKLNKLLRKKGNIDNVNTTNSHDETLRKIQQRNRESDLIERLNKKYAKALAKVTPKVELTQNLLKRFEEIDRRAIFMRAKYKIVFDFLKHPKMKRLESPKGTRILTEIRRKDGKLFGRLEILLFNKKIQPHILQYFIDHCKLSYKDCYIHKIMKDLFIEAGAVECSRKIFPGDSQRFIPHNRDGLVSLVLNNDGSLSPKFIITMQPMRIFDSDHLVIGKVVEGKNFITDLDAHGTKFGIPERMFFITVTSIRN